MSQSSWRLFKHASGRWYVRTRVEGRKVEWSTRTTDEGEARRRASEKFDGSTAGGRPPGGFVVAHEPTPAAPPAGEPAAAAAAPAPASDPKAARAAEIAARLKALGGGGRNPTGRASDSTSETVEPDEVIPPGASEFDDDEGDEEAGELLADAIAEGLVVGTVKLGHSINKARKPPCRAAEPNETCVRYAREGLQHRLRRALGKNTKLGPNAKIAVGLAGILITMSWGAEPIDSAAPPATSSRAAAAAPAPASSPAASDEDEAEPAPRQLVRANGAAAGGRFR